MRNESFGPKNISNFLLDFIYISNYRIWLLWKVPCSGDILCFTKIGFSSKLLMTIIIMFLRRNNIWHRKMGYFCIVLFLVQNAWNWRSIWSKICQTGQMVGVSFEPVIIYHFCFFISKITICSNMSSQSLELLCHIVGFGCVFLRNCF